MTPDDRELVAQVQAGNTEAFEALFCRYRAGVRLHVHRIVHDQGIAEDLTQEVFLRVWNRAKQWRGQGTFQGWLFRIATNLAISHLRKTQRRGEQLLDLPEDVVGEDDPARPPEWFVLAATLGPDAEFEQAERHRLLRKLVNGLPEDKREVFHLIYGAEMEVREAARKLGIPEGTVKSRLHHGRQHIAREWENLEPPEEK